MESGVSSSNGKKHVQQRKQRKRWVVPLIFASASIAIFLFSSSFFSSLYFLSPFAHSGDDNHGNHPVFVESKLRFINSNSSVATKNPIPRFAYLVSGSRGDGEALKRTLMAVYHPHNTYVLHLDLESSPSERLSLVAFVRDSPVFSQFGNVRVIVKANLVTYRGPTMVANTLHAAALLLKEGGDWDWFINLSASDYPLLTQDDLLYTFSFYPRHLNFIEHTSDIGWKEWHRAKPVIIDPGLYRLNKSDVFWITETRSLPTAFKLFTGSAWMMLTHDFMEYCIWGWDNLPRTVLMYYANFLSSPEGYFQTVICNAAEYRTSTVNTDLHLISWDNPPKQHPHFLNVEDFPKISNTTFPFARKFRADDPVLDVIDKELLHRKTGGFAAGGWMDGNEFIAVDLRPGPGAEKVKLLVDGLLAVQQHSDKNHCI